MREQVVKCDVCGEAKDCKAYWRLDVCDLCAQDTKVARLLEAVRKADGSTPATLAEMQRLLQGSEVKPRAMAMKYGVSFPK